MRMTRGQMETYEKDGYVLVPDCFSAAEVGLMRDELPALFSEDSPRRVAEASGGVVRSVYGSHATNEVFRRLTAHPLLVEPVRQLLGGDVYVYQFKINAKAAFDGDVWEWHQDYIFWLKEDGMPAARVVNVAVYLDDITEFNGPMFLIPGSHHEGVVASRRAEEPQTAYADSPTWISNLTAKIRYSVDKSEVERLATKYGLSAPKGKSGSVLFFDSNLVHASPANISPYNRAIVFITYNSVENVPALGENARPDFLASRDSEPLVPFASDALLSSHDGGPVG